MLAHTQARKAVGNGKDINMDVADKRFRCETRFVTRSLSTRALQRFSNSLAALTARFQTQWGRGETTAPGRGGLREDRAA